MGAAIIKYGFFGSFVGSIGSKVGLVGAKIKKNILF
jgi:hypothetical protein